MGIEGVKGAAMTYQGSTSAAETKEENAQKVEQSDIVKTAETLAQNTTSLDTKQSSGDLAESDEQQSLQEQYNAQLKKAVEDINKRANNSEAIFGIHEATNRVTIKIVDKETRKVIKEMPPEKTLDMIAKVWELAGLMVDEKR